MEKIAIRTFGEELLYQARCSRNCVCGNGKEAAMLVCWNCFKRSDNPLKWFEGFYMQWLNKKGYKIADCSDCGHKRIER